MAKSHAMFASMKTYTKSDLEKQLLVSLIKDDLTNVHLVGGLRRIGLNTDNHDLHLSETLLIIMGFDVSNRDATLHEEYIKRTQKIIDVNIVDYSKELDNMTAAIYIWLMKEKRERVYKKTRYEKKSLKQL